MAFEAKLGPLESSIGFYLRVALDASANTFSSRTEHLGMQPGLYTSMTLIHLNPGITQVQLSRATGRHMSTLTPILRALKALGYIERTQAPSDRRSYTLELTEEGERVLRQLADISTLHERELERIVGVDRKAEFLYHLRRIGALMR